MFTGSGFRPHSKNERGTVYIDFVDFAGVFRTTCVPLSSAYNVIQVLEFRTRGLASWQSL